MSWAGWGNVALAAWGKLQPACGGDCIALLPGSALDMTCVESG